MSNMFCFQCQQTAGLEWKVSLMICAYLSKLMKECVMIYILVTNFLSPICE